MADSPDVALGAACHAALRMSKGMVSNQNSGFHNSESRHKSHSIECIKTDDNNAPSGQFLKPEVNGAVG